ncbi:acetyltransferase [Paenibacillus curdlanolyticus YK9]|uniref:Acetyltransferase n=1 Tax=Paenibacillus curdlanolyticus YK9 TaxID=717606 RepID=E0I5H8_9BACL|nr:hypothetical protein [Paenibacillus curdlanolyticus]EFM12220.1 acetyltransferase [Paenibacillus curdlanolyticus YK9]
MNPEITVRRATIADVEGLARLNQAFNGGSLRPAVQIIESIQVNSEMIVVAEYQGTIVGFGCAQRVE